MKKHSVTPQLMYATPETSIIISETHPPETTIQSLLVQSQQSDGKVIILTLEDCRNLGTKLSLLREDIPLHLRGLLDTFLKRFQNQKESCLKEREARQRRLCLKNL